MRDFLDAIFAAINVDSLTDEEFAYPEIQALTEQEYTNETYKALRAVMDAREAVSGDITRLKGFFLSKGVDVMTVRRDSSNIFIGAPV